MGTRRGASLLAVLALVGAGTLAACGDDDDDVERRGDHGRVHGARPT